MNFLKNIDISNEYRISTTSILNWIENAILKKNNLHVELVGKKYKILNNAHNRSVLENLSTQANVYRNKIEIKKTKIHTDLYQYLSEDQLVELINRLEINKSVPLKFTYIGEGAKTWNNFTKNTENEVSYLAEIEIPKLVKKSLNLLTNRIPHGKKINIVDLGTGNSKSMLEITKYFNDLNLLKSYVGVDISKDMLKISKNNVLKLDNNIDYIENVFDFERFDFAKILYDIRSTDSINIIFFIEGTLGNTENIHRTLENFRYSLDNQDLLVVTNKVDSIEMRTQFEPVNRNSPHIWLTQYIGIDTDLCELGTVYDEKTLRRKGYFILDKDYEIEFTINNKTRIVRLFKGDHLVFWHHRMSERSKIFDELGSAGLTLLDFTTTNDLNFLLAVCQAER